MTASPSAARSGPGALAVAIVAILAGCSAAAAVDAEVGALRVTGAELVERDGRLELRASVENPTGTDRAFTVRWDNDGRELERSFVVDARTTEVIDGDDDAALPWLDGRPGGSAEVVLAQGFFPSSRDDARTVMLPVRAEGD